MSVGGGYLLKGVPPNRTRHTLKEFVSTGSTHFVLPNTDRMDAELDELVSDSDESTELPKLADLAGPMPLGVRDDVGVVRSFCCVASGCCCCWS